MPRPDGAPLPAPAGALVAPPLVRGPPKPLVGPPGRDGAPVLGAPDEGRALMGRDVPAPGGRLVEPPGMARRAPGGGGIGRPVADIGRPGGGGIGRPDELKGGRVPAPPSPSAPVPRCVGRMVVGPSGEAALVGTGLGAATRERTTLVGSLVGAGAISGARSRLGAGAEGTLTSEATGFAAGASRTALGVVVAVLVAFAGALVALATLVASSGCTSRRRPSASARRRMRSAWASSIDAEGLVAPIPSFWASASNSLLVNPSSLESSWTRIFFCAKTFPYFVCSHLHEHSYVFFHNSGHLLARPITRSVCTSSSLTDRRRARATCATCNASPHSPFAHHHTPRPSPRPLYHCPSAPSPARLNNASSRRLRQTTHVRSGVMPGPPTLARPRDSRPR